MFDFVTTIIRPRFGASKLDHKRNFMGQMSCVQMFNDAFNPAEIHMHKRCKQVETIIDERLCPEGFTYFDKMCYQVKQGWKARLGQEQNLC